MAWPKGGLAGRGAWLGRGAWPVEGFDWGAWLWGQLWLEGDTDEVKFLISSVHIEMACRTEAATKPRVPLGNKRFKSFQHNLDALSNNNLMQNMVLLGNRLL